MVYENKQDWPEKYDIKKLITREESINKLTSGKKVSERRNDRYADEGDEVLLAGHLFVVEKVFPQFLKNMTEQDAKDEGFASLAEYQDILANIHGGSVWNPDQLVWAHYLKEK